MLQFFIYSAITSAVVAYGNGNSAGAYSGPVAALATGGALSSVGSFSAGAGQVVPAAIQTSHQVEFRDVPSTGSVNPTLVEVGANSLPVTILFRSASSSLNVQQAHDGAQGSVQESSSDDEAHVLKHSVTKPIIQEVREVITPFRKITQEIQPVQEEINTIVSRNAGFAGQNAGLGFGSGVGLGSNGGHASGGVLSLGSGASLSSGAGGYSGGSSGGSSTKSSSGKAY